MGANNRQKWIKNTIGSHRVIRKLKKGKGKEKRKNRKYPCKEDAKIITSRAPG